MQTPWFGMTKAETFEKPGVTAAEIMAQIQPDMMATLNLTFARDSTNPHNDPFLVGRQYTYRRAKLEKQLEKMSKPNVDKRWANNNNAISSSTISSSSSTRSSIIKSLNHATASKLA